MSYDDPTVRDKESCRIVIVLYVRGEVEEGNSSVLGDNKIDKTMWVSYPIIHAWVFVECHEEGIDVSEDVAEIVSADDGDLGRRSLRKLLENCLITLRVGTSGIHRSGVCFGHLKHALFDRCIK